MRKNLEEQKGENKKHNRSPFKLILSVGSTFRGSVVNMITPSHITHLRKPTFSSFFLEADWQCLSPIYFCCSCSVDNIFLCFSVLCCDLITFLFTLCTSLDTSIGSVNEICNNIHLFFTVKH